MHVSEVWRGELYVGQRRSTKKRLGPLVVAKGVLIWPRQASWQSFRQWGSLFDGGRTRDRHKVSILRLVRVSC